jgi:phosphatidylinositol alpha-mannosyltransferase
MHSRSSSRHAIRWTPTRRIQPDVKVGIVVPFSWSYWGGVVEHAENQARALIDLGHDARIIIGNDPPGALTRLLHPREGRHGDLPPYVIPVGRTVIVPAAASLSNVCLSPRSMARMSRTFLRERFDVVHVHEPTAPILSPYALAVAPCPVVATAHSSGGKWYPWGKRLWRALLPRIDHRIAVSEHARSVAEPFIGGPIEVIPNGVALPPAPPHPGGRALQVAYLGRHEQRKGLPTLLRAWPEIRRETGARLRLMGADPLAVRFLMRRMGLDADGIDVLGIVTAERRDAELAQSALLAAPALGAESFGMVLTEAFAAATPVVASNIPGYREVVAPDTGVLVPPGDPQSLASAVAALLRDEPRRVELGTRARAVAEQRYSWPAIAARLLDIYGDLTGAGDPKELAAA